MAHQRKAILNSRKLKILCVVTFLCTFLILHGSYGTSGKGDVVAVNELSVAGFVSDLLNELNQVTGNFQISFSPTLKFVYFTKCCKSKCLQSMLTLGYVGILKT